MPGLRPLTTSVHSRRCASRCAGSTRALVTDDGQVQLNKNVVNGSEPFLRLIGDLVPCQNSRNSSELVFSLLVRPLSDTR